LESSAGLSWLRLAAWTVFALDLVILAQIAYADVSGDSEPSERALLRGLTVVLASGLTGIAIVLIVSSWKRNVVGLWVSLVCAAIPLLWVCANILTPAG
jgi:hypothetical protein